MTEGRFRQDFSVMSQYTSANKSFLGSYSKIHSLTGFLLLKFPNVHFPLLYSLSRPILNHFAYPPLCFFTDIEPCHRMFYSLLRDRCSCDPFARIERYQVLYVEPGAALKFFLVFFK